MFSIKMSPMQLKTIVVHVCNIYVGIAYFLMGTLSNIIYFNFLILLMIYLLAKPIEASID